VVNMIKWELRSRAIMSQPVDLQDHSLKASDIQRRYDGHIGAGYVSGEFFRERLLLASRWRERIFSRAQDSILDVACGSGENFAHYRRPGNTYTAVDLSPVMVDRARQRAQKLDMTVDLRVMDAEHLQFPDASFDTIVSAMSTCTFPNTPAVLHEMQRV